MVDTYANRVHVDCSSSGTGNLTLGSAITTAYQSFSGAGITNGATFPYTAYTSTQFECGHGSYSTTGPVLVRTAGNVVAGSAGAGSLTNFSSNPRVFLGPLAEDWPSGGGTPGGLDTQVQYNNASALGGMAGTAWNNTNRTLAMTASAHGGSTVPFSVLPDSGASFTKIFDNGTMVIDSDSGSGTYPLIAKYNGAEVMSVTFQGLLSLPQSSALISVASGMLRIDGGSIRFSEMSEPAANANEARIFAKDNGSGKTQLMVRFPSGSSVQLAIEP